MKIKYPYFEISYETTKRKEPQTIVCTRYAEAVTEFHKVRNNLLTSKIWRNGKIEEVGSNYRKIRYTLRG